MLLFLFHSLINMYVSISQNTRNLQTILGNYWMINILKALNNQYKIKLKNASHIFFVIIIIFNYVESF